MTFYEMIVTESQLDFIKRFKSSHNDLPFFVGIERVLSVDDKFKISLDLKSGNWLTAYLTPRLTFSGVLRIIVPILYSIRAISEEYELTSIPTDKIFISMEPETVVYRRDSVTFVTKPFCPILADLLQLKYKNEATYNPIAVVLQFIATLLFKCIENGDPGTDNFLADAEPLLRYIKSYLPVGFDTSDPRVYLQELMNYNDNSRRSITEIDRMIYTLTRY